jgi:predicted enzyme related to lactoylglutathione lyase
MVLKQSRLVTEDVEKLTHFYRMLTGATPEVFSAGYVEFQHNPCAGLAIVGAAVARVYGKGVVSAAENRSLVLDFQVDDVDAEYARLKSSIETWVQPPTDLPWGNRAMLFRDPDGNLINMFADPRRPANG